MINFRFHLVSLIAVFLALALGVVVGSTVIDRAIVDGLEAQIDRVERNAEEQRRENAELRQEIEALRVYAEQVAPFAVDERLTEVPVAVFGIRGIDEDTTRSAVALMRQAGGVAPAILWLEPALALVDAEDRAALRDTLGAERGSPDELRAAVFAALAQRIAAGRAGSLEAPPAAGEVPSGEETEATPAAGEAAAASPDETLTALIDGGFVTVDSAGAPAFDLAAFPGAGARVVLVSGPGAQLAADSVFLPFVEALAEASLLTLACEVPAPESEEADAAVVGLVRGGELGDQVSTVDGIDSVIGRVAVVLALQELGRGAHGHYGLGPGASRQLPEPAGV